MFTPSTPQPSGYPVVVRSAAGERAALSGGTPTPLLNPSVLRDMEREFADSAVVPRFARDFSVSLGDKIDRLDSRLRAGDVLAAQDAAVSLSTSADMIGAERLGEVARAALDILLPPGSDAGANLLLITRLRTCAAETLRELELSYPASA